MTHLTRLDIHGFKSFARPTSFVFNDGITAIIGPNGSGKSNVSEALRWVLGETRYSALRGRKTEDVIFAGSASHARLGLAEVTLTLDNTDGGLPIDFSEITVTRRADRSGDNQYLINGSRVRLRDVQQLTSSLGQAHTIIGQGLVDAVLSQRPEDRRGLFDHAAGISGLRLQANEAERGLKEAVSNTLRLRDILAELEPRVRSLRRAAKQARDYDDVRRELRTLQRGYYGALWRDSVANQRLVGDALERCDQKLRNAEGQQRESSIHLGQQREYERSLVEQHTVLQSEILEKEQLLAEVRHRHELIDAEVRAADRRQQDLAAALDGLSDQQAQAGEVVSQASIRIATLEADLQRQEAEIILLEAETEVQRQRKAELEAELEIASEQVLAITRQIAETEGRVSSAQAARDSSAAEHQQLEQEIQNARTAQSALASSFQESQAALDRLLTDKENADVGFQQLAVELDHETKVLESAIAEITLQRQQLDQLRSRLNVLEREYQEGEGLYAGPRAVMLGVRRGEIALPGLLGTLSELIRTPPKYDIAIEIALGGHLQDMVVERWTDAERAITFLKDRKAGRATFQPLDTVRRSAGRPALEYRGDGLIGVAADLLDIDQQVEPVVEGLLGRTLIVTDLQASRKILRSTRGWSLVTLAGEIARPSGSVTGGAYRRVAGILSRDRERRVLPGQIARLEDEIARQTVALAPLQADLSGKRGAVDRLRKESDHRHREIQQAQQLRDERKRQLDTINGSLERLVKREQETIELQSSVTLTSSKLQVQLANLQENHAQALHKRSKLMSDVAQIADSSASQYAELQIAAAANRERLNALSRERERAERQSEAVQKSLQAHQDQIAEINISREGQLAQQAECQEIVHTTNQQVARLREALVPVAQERNDIADDISRAEEQRDQAIQHVRQAERERDQAALQLTRSRDEQVYLADRISADLEVVDPEELVSEAGDADVDAERGIQRLRNRLRRMSAVSSDVVEEYRQESERFEYLTGQLADVEGAADDLAKVLSELRRKMSKQFDATFQDVAREFETTFKRLFAGGVARLTHEYEDGQATGVAISARPPGKRLQNLSQLSGGERALTAVALLIAIQRVNPSPFCLLDEVDAALDESNVLRFCDELRDLAQTTQYIVITHNRGTIEAANTLYGITMGNDKISNVLSLQLDQALESVGDQEHVESMI